MRTPRRPIEWPNDARIAILPTIVLETWPEEELGKPGSAQASFRHDRGLRVVSGLPQIIAECRITYDAKQGQHDLVEARFKLWVGQRCVELNLMPSMKPIQQELVAKLACLVLECLRQVDRNISPERPSARLLCDEAAL